jgi:hypothetical protein
VAESFEFSTVLVGSGAIVGGAGTVAGVVGEAIASGASVVICNEAESPASTPPGEVFSGPDVGGGGNSLPPQAVTSEASSMISKMFQILSTEISLNQ